jgi:hypothetical protein
MSSKKSARTAKPVQRPPAKSPQAASKVAKVLKRRQKIARRDIPACVPENSLFRARRSRRFGGPFRDHYGWRTRRAVLARES